MTPRAVVLPLEISHNGHTYAAEDREHADRFAAALAAATRKPATVRSTDRTCQACGGVIRGLLACCSNPACVDATSAAEKRADRWAD